MSGQLTAVVILWVAAAMSQAAEVYKIVDADGNITYTDQPGASAAERLNLPQINQTTAPACECNSLSAG
jgi:predicted porin